MGRAEEGCRCSADEDDRNSEGPGRALHKLRLGQMKAGLLEQRTSVENGLSFGSRRSDLQVSMKVLKCTRLTGRFCAMFRGI